MVEKKILISIIIPCRNEVAFIEDCIKSLLSQDNINNNEIEIIVVDGDSSDGTKDILNRYLNSGIKIINNPLLVTPIALNLGVKTAKGEYIAILGAHSVYPPNYLNNSLKLFKKQAGILGVGGPIVSKGTNNFSKATALCMSSTIGVGNAKHRFPEYEGFAEMACFPVFHKTAFEIVGYYDEKLIKNQDDEFCFRLNKRGYKIYISPSVQAIYYVRSNPKKLFLQYYDYGYWRVPVLIKHGVPISFRQLIPGLFFLILFLVFISGILLNAYLTAVLLPILYIISGSFYALYNIPKIGFRSALYIPLVLFILHFSYAIGFYKGWYDFLIVKKWMPG